MKSEVFKKLTDLEESVRVGDHVHARRELAAISPASVPRELYSMFANLLRRTGLNQKGLRLLNPLIRDPKLKENATDEEKIEYSILLLRVGALHEARAILKSIDKDKNPVAILYMTFTLTPEWRYRDTIKPLQDYLSLSGNKPYQNLVAQVNLIAAYIFCGDYASANLLLLDSNRLANSLGARFLSGSLCELEAQMHIAHGAIAKAEEALNKASTLLKSSESVESLYVRKWRSICELYQATDKTSALSNLVSLRKLAVSKNEWEVVRDIDFHSLYGQVNPKAFRHIFCGSPSPDFRERLLRTYPQYGEPAPLCSWSGSGAERGPEFLIDSGTTRAGEAFIVSGQAQHRLLRILCRDYYRPVEIANVAADLYPDEYYHPTHTPAKVHQILSRLRESLGSRVRIECRNGAIKLSPRGCTLTKNWQFDSQIQCKVDIELQRLFSEFANGKFSAKEASMFLGVSVSSATRRLNQACSAGILERSGKGPATRYQVLAAPATLKSEVKSAS